MERVEQFGDPWFLLLAEDYIVLKLETPWPVDVPLPDGYSMGDDDGRLLVTNQASLVSATNSLRETRISEALFAGCAAFESSNVFEASAREVLRFAGEICIVHNRDTIYKLIRMFPNAKVLALPHDLCFHAVDLDEPYRCRGEPLVPTSELRVLEGSTRIGCASSLLLTEDTVLEIVRTCPKLCPELKTLRLVSCEISSDDAPLDYDAFPKLRTVELCVKLLRVVFDAFLYATSGTLRNLRLAGDASCRGFLHLCCLRCEPISFPCLEELTLDTALTIDALQVKPEDLHKLLTSLPALRHLSTDSYDLRLFFENYCVPRGSVSLSWCECVYCCVHRPCDESSDEEAAVIRDCLGLPM
ncbi:hypothetical protein V5799_000052 [Amblyomma americanum]|uniref:Uncharacterized protein n=1 Tax=Amblyomma americanum TaxID=6943 RepID=A0AAQ4D452_AMBAM